METATEIPPIAPNQRAHRSAVSNGTRLFCVDGLDGRSQTARRFRDLVETFGNDLGGQDLLSEGQRQLIRRAATLSIMAEAMEADVCRNMAFDIEFLWNSDGSAWPVFATSRSRAADARFRSRFEGLPRGQRGCGMKADILTAAGCISKILGSLHELTRIISMRGRHEYS